MRGRYDGAPGLTLTAEMRFLHYGLVQDPYRILKAEVLDRRGDPVDASEYTWSGADGRYTVVWNVPVTNVGGLYRDAWTVWLTEADWNLDHPAGGPDTELHTTVYYGSIAVGLPPAWTAEPGNPAPPGTTTRYNAQQGCIARLRCFFTDRTGYPTDPAVLEPVEIFVGGVSQGYVNPLKDARGQYSVLYRVPETATAGVCEDVWRFKWTSQDISVREQRNRFDLVSAGYYAAAHLEEVDLRFVPENDRFVLGTVEYLKVDVAEAGQRLNRLPSAAIQAWRLNPDDTKTPVVLGLEPECRGLKIYQLMDTGTLGAGLYEYQVTVPWGQENIRSRQFHFRVVP